MRKTLKNNREVAHIWAQQRQSEGKSGNMFFEGATIYSYGHHFPIARFARPDTVLLTSKRYSVSTAKHINYTRQALRGGLTVLEVSDVSANTNGDHLQNLVRLVNEYNVWVEKAKRAFHHCLPGDGSRADIKAYRKLFRVKGKIPKLNKLNKEELAKYETRIKGLDERRKVRDEKNRLAYEERAKQREIEQQEAITKWVEGENVNFPYGIDTVYLRFKDKRIQTSKGAEISVKTAFVFWDKLKASEDVKGFDFGPYTVDSFDGQTLVVGCHRIGIEQINRIAGLLGLTPNE